MSVNDVDCLACLLRKQRQFGINVSLSPAANPEGYEGRRQAEVVRTRKLHTPFPLAAVATAGKVDGKRAGVSQFKSCKRVKFLKHTQTAIQ